MERLDLFLQVVYVDVVVDYTYTTLHNYLLPRGDAGLAAHD